MVLYDIETGPRPWMELVSLVPGFDPLTAVPAPGDFDPSQVKFGRTTDPAKRKALVDAAWAKHEALVASVAERRDKAREDWISAAKKDAALSPLTGSVRAIGLSNGESSTILHCQPGDLDDALCAREICGFGGEAEMLVRWWEIWGRGRGEHRFVGFYSHVFDLPFLVTRSRMLGVDVPSDVVRWGASKYPNWHSSFVDLHPLWSFGNNASGRPGQACTLDSICAATGGPRKPEGVHGGHFAGDYDAGGERRDVAFEYLFGDLGMTLHVANLSGVA